MNNKEKIEAVERKIERIAKEGGICEGCGKMPGADKLQLAHRIMQASESGLTIKYVQKYVLETYNEEIKKQEAINILNHDLNMAVSCVKCNDSFNIWNNPEKRKAKIRAICNKIYGWSEEV
ncbi:MAG: hypothetical protein GY782_06210 [Gammaproteobacteria bacterium]|nr:hypothetical protein [Gammaproteobacteria bacterium]